MVSRDHGLRRCGGELIAGDRQGLRGECLRGRPLQVACALNFVAVEALPSKAVGEVSGTHLGEEDEQGAKEEKKAKVPCCEGKDVT